MKYCCTKTKTKHGILPKITQKKSPKMKNNLVAVAAVVVIIIIIIVHTFK